MPPPPRSLPLRDGRLGSSSLLSGGPAEHYYTNDEIELIHQVVIKAEDILPHLPERDRLPTNALFRAVEVVLPQHGYDPDRVPAPLSRLIFKIGGLRGDGQLMDKFRTVLGKMGIELEFVQNADEQEEEFEGERRRSPSPHSSRGSADQTGVFPLSGPVQGRRRRNSGGSAPSLGSVEDDDNRLLPAASKGRPRAASFSTLDRGRGEVLESTEELDFTTGWPVYKEGRRRREDGRPLPIDYEADDESAINQHSLPELPKEPSRPQYDLVHRGAFPSALQQRAEVPDSYEVEGSPSTAADTENLPPSAHSGGVESEGLYRGASDTTVQSADDEPDMPMPRSTEAQLEKRYQLHQAHVQHHLPLDYLRAWRDEAQFSEEDQFVKRARADQLDAEWVVPEVLEIWDEHAFHEAQERLDAENEARREAENARRERCAGRAYELFIAHKALTHWAACAEEEAQRTATARRHILRKRIFNAWRGHNAQQNARALNFAVASTLKLWIGAATDSEEIQDFAVQKYDGDVVALAFRRWVVEYQSRLAGQMESCSLTEYSLKHWSDAASHRVSLDGVCGRRANDMLVSNAVSRWGAVTDQQRDMAKSGMATVLSSQCRIDMRDWDKYATLTSILRKQLAARDDQLAVESLQHWSVRIEQADQSHGTARELFAREFMQSWMCETEVCRFVEQQEEEAAADAIYYWYLAEKLAFFERYSEEKTLRHTLDVMIVASERHQTLYEDALRTAEHLDLHNTVPAVLTTWWAETEDFTWHEKAASALTLQHKAGDSLDAWSAGLAEMAAWPQWADRGAYFCAVSDALSWWPQAAKKAREERITKIYHAFRQRLKTALASDCLLAWRAATEDTLGGWWEAEQMWAGKELEASANTFAFWDAYAQNQEACMAIAGNADLEVAVLTWASAAGHEAELGMDAVDLDTGQTLNRCWENWELSSLQMRGREYTVYEVLEKHSRKLCRRVLGAWSQGTSLEALQDEGHSFRGSGRQGGNTNTPRHNISTPAPQSLVSSRGSEFRASSRSALPDPQLSRISERDEMPQDSLLAFTTSPAVQHGMEISMRDSRVNNNPFDSARTGTDRTLYSSALSAQLAGRRSSATSLGAGEQRGGGVTDLTSSSRVPVPTTRRPRDFNALAPQPSYSPPPSRAGDGATSYYETPYHTAVSGFAGSVQQQQEQLPPMMEFDEDDEFSAADDGTQGPVLMSTPTRWTGQARPLGYRPTTTPLAPLPSPYERILRHGYASGTASADATAATAPVPTSSSRQKRASIRQTPRVTFAETTERDKTGGV